MSDTEAQGSPDQALADDWAAALGEQTETAPAAPEPASIQPTEAGAANADSGGKPAADERNLDLVLDIPVTMSMEIGRVKVPIRNLLQLTQGSVVELDRLAGEPLDVLVNGTLIAHGEVVVVNERYGIRFTDVVSPAERVQGLR